MNHISRWVVVSIFLAINSITLSLADEQVSKEVLGDLIKGNTVEGKRIKWETTYRMYFVPDGDYRRVDSLDNKENGTWRVESNGELCMLGSKVRSNLEGKEKCRIVKKRSDGGYDVYNYRGRIIWTIDKISSGDPYNLKP